MTGADMIGEALSHWHLPMYPPGVTSQ